MKRMLLAAIMICISLLASAQTLNEVLNDHFEAINQEKRSTINTLVYEGLMIQGMEIPVKLIIKRPGMVRMEGVVMGNKFIQAYNGTEGFMILPGSSEPESLNEQQTASMKDMATLDSELAAARQNNFEMEFQGMDTFEGNEVYKIKVVNDRDTETVYYLDSEHYVILKVVSSVVVNGQTIVGETIYSDYVEEEGMLFPKTFISNNEAGETLNEIRIDDIYINEPVSDKLFSRPDK